MGTPFVWFDVRTKDADNLGWFPYIQVQDLDAATTQATELGATALQAPAEGPAGTYAVIQEPGGAVFALFHPRA